MRPSKAFGNHDDNSTVAIDPLLETLVKRREAKKFLVSVLINTWVVSEPVCQHERNSETERTRT